MSNFGVRWENEAEGVATFVCQNCGPQGAAASFATLKEASEFYAETMDYDLEMGLCWQCSEEGRATVDLLSAFVRDWQATGIPGIVKVCRERAGMQLCKLREPWKYVCSRCRREKKAKSAAFDVANPTLRICNACYGQALAAAGLSRGSRPELCEGGE